MFIIWQGPAKHHFSSFILQNSVELDKFKQDLEDIILAFLLSLDISYVGNKLFFEDRAVYQLRIIAMSVAIELVLNCSMMPIIVFTNLLQCGLTPHCANRIKPLVHIRNQTHGTSKLRQLSPCAYVIKIMHLALLLDIVNLGECLAQTVQQL